MIRVIDSPGSVSLANIHDLHFIGAGFATNTIVAVFLDGSTSSGCVGATVADCSFDNTFYAVRMDQGYFNRAANLLLINTSTIYVGSSVSTANCFWPRLDNISLLITGVPAFAAAAVITLYNAIGTSVMAARIPFGTTAAVGISITGNSQGTAVISAHIVGPKAGIMLQGTSSAIPVLATKIIDTSVDGWTVHGIQVSDYSNYTVISNCSLTGGSSGGGSDAISVSQLAVGTQVLGNLFENISVGNGIVLADGSKDVQVHSNLFDSNSSSGAEVSAPGTTSTKLSLLGNMRGSSSETMSTYISASSDDSTVFIRNNTGVDDLVQSVTSASTITVTGPVATVSGSATITTLTISTSYRGPVTLVPASGSTWKVATGGNIGANSTSVVGKAMTLYLAGTTPLWHPSY